jgi:hypothetical protein
MACACPHTTSYNLHFKHESLLAQQKSHAYRSGTITGLQVCGSAHEKQQHKSLRCEKAPCARKRPIKPIATRKGPSGHSQCISMSFQRSVVFPHKFLLGAAAVLHRPLDRNLIRLCTEGCSCLKISSGLSLRLLIRNIPSFFMISNLRLAARMSIRTLNSAR